MIYFMVLARWFLKFYITLKNIPFIMKKKNN